MKTQLATIRITGAVEKSTQVMASMNRLMKIPEMQKTMQEMSKEMMKMGIIEELMDDAMGSLDDDDIEEDADKEVNKFGLM
jgi:charged multivesicular body protein 3